MLCKGRKSGDKRPSLSWSAYFHDEAHPVTSSWAMADLAIMMAVGFWICISRSRTLPSLVSLMSVYSLTSGRTRTAVACLSIDPVLEA